MLTSLQLGSEVSASATAAGSSAGNSASEAAATSEGGDSSEQTGSETETGDSGAYQTAAPFMLGAAGMAFAALL